MSCIYRSALALLVMGVGSVKGETLLDYTFDTDGRVITNTGPHVLNQGFDLTFQTDGKIVVAGQFTTGTNGSQFGAARYLSDGSLDGTFGTGGITTTATFANSAAYAKSVAIQPDGKIVVAGNGVNIVVVRYLPDGSLDPTFNGTGRLLGSAGTGAGGYFYCERVAIQADGKIVVCGTHYNGSRGFMNVVRYLPDGSLDTTYAGTGKTQLALSENSYAHDMVLQSDGKILIAGVVTNYTAGESDAALVRYDANGVLDSTFNGTGIVTHRLDGRNSAAASVALQADGKIVIGGKRAIDGGTSETGELFHMMAARYEADGTLDTTFNGSGFATADLGVDVAEVASVVMQGDKVVLVGTRHDPGGQGNNNADFAIVRFLATGALDTSFKLAGMALTDFGKGQDQAFAGAVQADGKIVAVGMSSYAVGSYTTDLVMARYNLDGASAPGLDDGGGVGMQGPPKINRAPLSQIVPLGSAFNLYCSHSGAPPFSYQWFKNGVAIAGATGRSYSVPMNVSSADVGKYAVKISNAQGNKTSKVAYIGVINTETQEVEVEATRKATLSARAVVPSGSPAKYQWYHEGEPLGNGHGITGVKTPTLNLNNPGYDNGGSYSCVVTMGSGIDGNQWNQSDNQVTIVAPAPKPVMSPVALTATTVNEAITISLSATNKPKRFEAWGLPPGKHVQNLTASASGPAAGTATVTLAANGVAIWVGKLSDGTAFTGSSASGPGAEVAVHRLLYSNTGSLQGWVTLGTESPAGKISWLKPGVSSTAQILVTSGL